jgi:hypothetical protein
MLPSSVMQQLQQQEKGGGASAVLVTTNLAADVTIATAISGHRAQCLPIHYLTQVPTRSNRTNTTRYRGHSNGYVGSRSIVHQLPPSLPIHHVSRPQARKLKCNHPIAANPLSLNSLSSTVKDRGPVGETNGLCTELLVDPVGLCSPCEALITVPARAKRNVLAKTILVNSSGNVSCTIYFVQVELLLLH